MKFEGFGTALQEAAPFLMGLSSDLRGDSSGGAALGLRMIQERADSKERKAKIEGLLGKMGLTDAEKGLLETMPVSAQQSYLLNLMNRRRAGAGGPSRADIVRNATNAAFGDIWGQGVQHAAAPSGMPGDPPTTPDRVLPVQPGEAMHFPSPAPAPVAPAPMSGDVLGLNSPLAQRFEGPVSPHGATAALSMGVSDVSPSPPAVEQVAQAPLSFGADAQATGAALPLPMGGAPAAPAVSATGLDRLRSKPPEWYDEQIARFSMTDDPNVNEAQVVQRLKTLKALAHPEPVERKILADRNGVQRYADTGEPVFADVQDPPEPAYDPKDLAAFRNEFNGLPVVKNFRTQVSAVRRVVDSANRDSPAGDLALIFAFMKAQDPTSVVRESEFATAESASAWLQESEQAGAYVPRPVAQAIRKVATGNRLGPEQRKDFVDTSLAIYQGAEAGYTDLLNEYTRIAEELQYPVSQAIVDFRYAQPAATPVEDGEDPLGIR